MVPTVRSAAGWDMQLQSILCLMRKALLTVAALLAVATIPARADDKKDADDTVDVAPVRGKLKLVGDGKGHWVAFVPFAGLDDDTFFYSADGKDFWSQRQFGGGSEGD